MKALLFALVGALALTQGLLSAPSAGEVQVTPAVLESPLAAAAAVRPGAPATAASRHGEPSARPIVLAGSSTVGTSKPHYITTATIKPRSGRGSGARLGSATKGYTVWGTGKTSKGYTQIRFLGRTGWVKSNLLKRLVVAKYTAKQPTDLRSKANGGTKLATVGPDYTLGTVDNARNKSRSWVRVQYKGTTGWVALKHLKRAPLGKAVGPGTRTYSDAAWAKAVSKNISRYCPRTTVRVSHRGNEYYAQSSPLRITLSRVGHPDPGAAPIRAVALHECAHIMQFRAYPRGFSKLVRHAEKINPRRDGYGIEHLADCMSDLMGAKRSGHLADGSTYYTGYHGKCSSTQKRAAARLIAGKRPA